MRLAVLSSLTLLAIIGCLGCAGAIDAGPPLPGQDQGAADHGDADLELRGADGGVDGLAPPPSSYTLGVVVIDAQEAFVKIAANKDMTQILANIRAVLTLAGTHKPPLLITYEASKDAQSGHNLTSTLSSSVPSHAQEFIKTTFAATGLPAFASAVQQAAVTHLIVVGAETDVCVLQTVLGLRAMGKSVVLQQDAVFTSESNTGPALRRMVQAGVSMASMAQVKAYLAGTSPLPPAQSGPVTILKTTGVAVILGNLTDGALAASQDAHKAAKIARLRELLLISEWFDLPLYATSGATLPSQLSGLITKPILPVAQLAQASGVKQIVLAGTDASLASLIASHGAARDVFLLEDGLLSAGASAGQAAALEQLYKGGAVPLTYKSLYYGLTKSVDLSEWPKAWKDRDPTYYPKTKAPEDLPPIVK